MGCDSTLYLPAGLTLESVEAHIKASIGVSVPHALASAAQSSPTGACLFSSGGLVVVLPPFPVREIMASKGCEEGPLMKMIDYDWTIAIVLVRLGAYAVGACRGERLVASKVGTGLVHSRQRQGGSSSQRFRRRREKQIEQFLIRVCEKVRDHLGPLLNDIDFVAYGGARTTIDLFKKRCTLLSEHNAPELPSLLDIPDPRQPVLEAAVTRVWSSRVFEWKSEDEASG